MQLIIQQFAAQEEKFRAAFDNYNYHQINRVEELGRGDEVVGRFQQEWTILRDASGKRTEIATNLPVDTLKSVTLTTRDTECFRNLPGFVISPEALSDYEIKYVGHAKEDQISAYVFSIDPTQKRKDRQFFQGFVWVDDREWQIVKTAGKLISPGIDWHGKLLPRFTTWREQVDGKFWFPSYAASNETLYSSEGSLAHIREVVHFTDYKQSN